MKNIKGLGNITLAIMIPIFLFEIATFALSLLVWDIKGVHAVAWHSDMAIAVVTVSLLIASLIAIDRLFGARMMVMIPLITLALTSCQKDDPPAPSPGGGTRSLSAYESSLVGDWVMKRQDLYDTSGTTYYTMDYPDTMPANSKSHYKFTGDQTTTCTATNQWVSRTGTPINEIESCWRAVTDTIFLGSYKYEVELFANDSLVFKLSQPGAGYRLYFKR